MIHLKVTINNAHDAFLGTLGRLLTYLLWQRVVMLIVYLFVSGG